MIQLEITTTQVGTTEQVTTLIEVAGAGPQGPIGPVGPQGPQGEPGVGVLPAGGETGEVLVKLSATDQDAGWTDDLQVDSLTFNPAAGLEATAEGELVWDDDAGTIDLAMNDGVLQRVGEDTFYRVQADEAIAKGDLVMSVGTVGNSGQILVAKSRPTYNGNPVGSQQLMGLSAGAIAQGQRGYVVGFGRVRGVNTDAFNEGDILWADPTTPGGLTATRPIAPNWKTIIALVITKSAQVGTLQVRPTFGSSLANDELVNLNGIADNYVLRYDGATARFEAEALGTAADANVGDFATAAQGSLADTATQPGDNVSTLTNDANYIDSAGAPVQSVDGFTGTVDLSGEYDALGSASGVQSNLTAHTSATTNVHGIADTSDLIVEGDARLTNERTPLDGSVTSAKIAVAGLAPSDIAGTAVIDNDARLTDQRVPTDGSVTDAKITVGGLSPSSVTGTAVIDSDARLSDERTPVDGSVTTAKIDAAGLAPSAITGTAVIDSDARLSDERTPLDGSVTDAKVAVGAEIAQSKISGLTTTLAGKANLVAGKVPQSELPAIAFTEVYVVADIPARDALTVQEGDVAIVQNTGAGESASYIYDGTAWQELLTPTDGVTAVTASGGLDSTGGTTPDVFIQNLGIVEGKIADGAVTNIKLAGSIDPAKITGTAVVDGDARLSEGTALSETVRSLGTGATQALPGDYDVAGQAPVQSVASKTGAVTLVSADVGLGNVPNLDTTDAVNKAHDQNTDTSLAFGTADQVTATEARAHIDATNNPHGVTATQVGLGNVDNTSDLDKPISTATQTALNGKADETITITGTNGLEGGGDLTANRALQLTAASLASLNLADSALQSGDPATAIAYDNTASGLTATTVQGAIDEIVGILANVLELNTGS